ASTPTLWSILGVGDARCELALEPWPVLSRTGTVARKHGKCTRRRICLFSPMPAVFALSGRLVAVSARQVFGSRSSKHCGPGRQAVPSPVANPLNVAVAVHEARA